MKHIPNLFTLLNLIFGCLAIVVILQNGIVIQYSPEGNQWVDIPEKIWMASFFISLAALVDFADGFVARLFNASSEMGKQLDSLADVVSFGVAPSMIMYQLLRISFAKNESGIDASSLLLLPAFIIAAAAAYRLAKFNLDTKQQYGFRGVPTPAVGLLIASFPLIYWYSENSLLIQLLTNCWVLYVIILLVSALMVSNLPLLALKFKSKTTKETFPLIILSIVALAAVFLFGWASVPLIFISYVIISLIFKIKTGAINQH